MTACKCCELTTNTFAGKPSSNKKMKRYMKRIQQDNPGRKALKGSVAAMTSRQKSSCTSWNIWPNLFSRMPSTGRPRILTTSFGDILFSTAPNGWSSNSTLTRKLPWPRKIWLSCPHPSDRPCLSCCKGSRCFPATKGSSKCRWVLLLTV